LRHAVAGFWDVEGAPAGGAPKPVDLKWRRRAHNDAIAPHRWRWLRRNHYYHADLERFFRFVIPPGKRVLDIGCATGELLAALEPSRGLGIDLSPEMIRIAREQRPPARFRHLEFRVGDAELLRVDETFDYVVLSNVLGEVTDVWKVLREIRRVCHPGTRLVVAYHNALWEPLLRLGERLGIKAPQPHQNWLSMADVSNLLALNGFEMITKGERLLLPRAVPLLSGFLNRLVARLPGFRHLCLTTHLVARPLPEQAAESHSVTVVVPCRNERGNVRAAVERTPEMGSHTEIIFVDGNSNDGTVEEIERVIREYAGRRDVKLLHQVPPGSEEGAGHGKMLKLGKGDAVRKGFAAAAGDILMILDADLTVPPEELPKFYLALAERRGELVNGTRLVYPMEREAMRFLNKVANRCFGILFTWLCGQRLKDTLCGTKVLFRRDYERIAAGRSFFGNFDPFGDFDLLFGATKQHLRIAELPVRYRERTYGEVKIRRFKHGVILLRMSALAMRKLKLA
jgi:SAM-dependent methyltransferase/glycosyltransferase involved in cell wall biosynthesis